jgi:hypothetical protein
VTEPQLRVAEIELKRRAADGDSVAKRILDTFAAKGGDLAQWKGGFSRLLGAAEKKGPLLMAMLGAGLMTNRPETPVLAARR